ncbi:hypothetical protein CIRG_06925 [Coccidioides immitis RMSCC 2394]|uniref:Uncharacterized protein n=1 Tax=Coccidioides immitis RMSCC 2394 TaxID=404692 RepID=A0A0J6YJH5_COCIT|nr:hypothetical protein CIRG_06925 [Coccidioides immitis RMSCC 2394]
MHVGCRSWGPVPVHLEYVCIAAFPPRQKKQHVNWYSVVTSSLLQNRYSTKSLPYSGRFTPGTHPHPHTHTGPLAMAYRHAVKLQGTFPFVTTPKVGVKLIEAWPTNLKSEASRISNLFGPSPVPWISWGMVETQI